MYEELVALTGIEGTCGQFSLVQFGLSVCKHVQLVSSGRARRRYESATLSLGCHSSAGRCVCEPRVPKFEFHLPSQTSPLRVRPLLVDCHWVANSPEMANTRASTLAGGIARESQEGRIKLAVRRSAATFSVSPQSEAQLVNWLRRAEPLSSMVGATCMLPPGAVNCAPPTWREFWCCHPEFR